MELLPDLGRLSLRPCPTGVDPPPLSAGAAPTPARNAVVTDNALLVLILTALNEGARDDAAGSHVSLGVVLHPGTRVVVGGARGDREVAERAERRERLAHLTDGGELRLEQLHRVNALVRVRV